MKPAATEHDHVEPGDPFPTAIEIVRRRRRSVELSLESGQLVARVPMRLARRELDLLIPELRERLWRRLRASHVFDQETLAARARWVAEHRLAALALPPFTVRFSARQRRRWGSCTADGSGGSIRISDRLVGHPTWVLDHLLHHELIHLRVANHGDRFQRLLAQCPHAERAAGYLEALETVALLQDECLPLPSARVTSDVPRPAHDSSAANPLDIASRLAPALEGLPLFAPPTTSHRD